MSHAHVRAPVQAVLFDLDGTLADSAPDLAAAGNEMRLARGLAALELAVFRPMVGSGARGMLQVALNVNVADADFDQLRYEFLQRYEACLTQDTCIFPAMLPVLEILDKNAFPWGIVTNKAARFGDPLIQALGLGARAATWVCGDTTAHAKPHPEPLWEAARRMGVDAAACAYVGDDLRDIQAGLAAGMMTVAVRWGYLGLGPNIETWGADHVIEAPEQLLGLLTVR
jgi:N-acetyl-D-muramate 6-phosphate phosphatase